MKDITGGVQEDSEWYAFAWYRQARGNKPHAESSNQWLKKHPYCRGLIDTNLKAPSRSLHCHKKKRLWKIG